MDKTVDNVDNFPGGGVDKWQPEAPDRESRQMGIFGGRPFGALTGGRGWATMSKKNDPAGCDGRDGKMEANFGYFGTMGAIALALLALFCLDRLCCRREPPERPLPRREGTMELMLFLLSFLVLFLLNDHRFVYYNNYSYLADALLHGHLYVDGMPAYLESVEFGGHVYMHFAPGPAILCLPFVAIFGIQGFNIAWLSLLLGAANTSLAYRVLRQMGIGRDRRERLWCGLLLTFGTVHCFLAALGHGWFLGHVSSWFFLLLGMAFLTVPEERRKDVHLFLAGLFYGCAVTCRMPNLLGALFFFGYILTRYKRETWLRSLLFFCLGAAVPGGLYMAYNYVRFGTIMDKGYNLTHLKDKHRALYLEMQELPKAEQLSYLKAAEKEVGGPLQKKYIAFNLYSIFLLGPEFKAEYPYVIPTLAGVSLTHLSPALYAAGWVDYRKDKLPWFLLATAVVCAVPFLMNYGNGFAQFGMRYAMDFIPYVGILAAMGMTRKPMGGWKVALILLCMLLNMWGPVYWNIFYA